MSRAAFSRWAAVVALSLAVAGSLAGSASPSSQRTVTVRVTALDFSYELSGGAVRSGSTVRFVVRNRGYAPHDLVITGKRTRILQPGQSQTIAVRFERAGRFQFFCSVPGHKRLGMRRKFSVGRPLVAPPPPPPPMDVSDVVTLTRIGAFERPVLVTAPPGDTERIFVVEQTGVVRIVRDGQLLERPFLDLRDGLKITSESGLLSLTGEVFRLDPKLSG